MEDDIKSAYILLISTLNVISKDIEYADEGIFDDTIELIDRIHNCLIKFDLTSRRKLH